MALKIDSSSLFSRNYLLLKKDGFKFYENSMLWGARTFRFADVSCALMSADHQLSFQVGNEVFCIAVKPEKPKHAQTLSAFLTSLENSRLPPGSAVRYQP